jgi:phosphopantothenoylcysteine synthetase/decarboxylase
LTQVQLKTIQGFWNTTTTCTQNEIYVVSPQVKELACGEVGAGALASVDDILQAVNKCCARRRLRFT